ncbi:LysR family transcriptional regulator [Peribacillus kribbensis]|uniref:LysR family transcriptional regulator n=1 Tax=Peribacillus kribbensis TaxID=356658 RepID=UPI0003FC991F|nr:LysR family transcriptional regulator [Peribacillus kribbensis]
MDIRQLRYFIAIVEEGSISAASRRLHIAQPPLSQQLKQMEEELGVILLERSGKKPEITEAGHALYKHAVKMTSLMSEGVQEIKEIGQGIQGQLHIGVNTLSSYSLSRYLLEFKERYPNVTYKIIQSDSPHLGKLIESRQLDLAIVRVGTQDEHFHYKVLERDYFAAIFPKGSEFGTDSMDIRQASSHPLILPSVEGLGIHSMIMKEFKRLGLKPEIIGECSDMALLLQLVSSGFGTSIVPKSVLDVHPGIPVTHAELTNTRLESAAAAVWPKHRYLSKAAERFISLL